MFCPRCSQEQVSNDTRFCSRCGFLLEVVAEVLANGGVLPQLLELNQKKTWLTKKNGVLFSIFWMIFFVLILTPFWGILDVDALAGISAIVGIFGGLMLLLASLVFLKKTPPQFSQALPATSFQPNISGAQPNNLPPQQSQPVNDYVSPTNNWKVPNTGEFAAKPPSVTEGTTKLFNKDE